MDIDAAFDHAKSWWDSLPSEAQTEIDRVAQRIKELGREPNFAFLMGQFADEFPGHAPRTTTTWTATIRRRVEIL